MAEFNYSSIAVTADRLLKRFGQPLEFSRTTKGTYDPTQGTTPTTTSTYQATSVWLGYSVSEIDGVVVKQGDAKVYTSHLDTRPLIGDMVDKDGSTWRVQNVMPVQPANVNVIYQLQVRK